MKKVILLLSILLLSGCYDYKELNNLSIVSTITIDKDENNYLISYEVLNDQKENNSATNKSIIISGKGLTVASAIANTNQKTPKEAYLAHVKVLAITRGISKQDLKEITDYFLRDPSIRNEFYLFIVNSNYAKDILDIKNNEIPTISDNINLQAKSNSSAKENFEDIMINILEDKKDAIIPVISIIDNSLVINKTAILNEYEIKEILSPKESDLLNILNNNTKDILLTYNCPTSNDKIILSIYNAKTNYELNNKLTIKLDIMAEIEEYNCKNNLKDSDTFKLFNNYYSKRVKNDINKTYEKLIINNSDILGIENKLYIKNRNVNVDWRYLNYQTKINLKINKEGLIYEIK